jgi:AcrR family transcriptional regulator
VDTAAADGMWQLRPDGMWKLRYMKAMVVARTPRSAWIEAGLRALAAGGPDAVRIEALARVLSVTKGGFYWHFDNRHALLDDILDEWERVSVDEVIEHIEVGLGDGAGDARAKLERLGAIAVAGDTVLGIDPLEVDLAIRDWARRDEKVARRLRRVDNRRMDYMRSLFGTFIADEAEIEDRCLLLFSLWIGSHFIAADHRGRSRASVVERAFRRLLDA